VWKSTESQTILDSNFVYDDQLRFSIIKRDDNGCANISISLNLESMQVNLFDTIQTSRKIVYTSVFVRLTAFVDNVLSLLIWTLNNEQ
jgi:hypothetical protein